jgi:hypothetical protein
MPNLSFAFLRSAFLIAMFFPLLIFKPFQKFFAFFLLSPVGAAGAHHILQTVQAIRRLSFRP